MDPLSSRSAGQRGPVTGSPSWRAGKKRHTSPLLLSGICHDWPAPRTESRSCNLPLWMKSAIAYAFCERVKKISGYTSWTNRAPSNHERFSELNAETAAAIDVFLSSLDGLEQPTSLRPLLKILLVDCREVITQLVSSTIVHEPELTTGKAQDTHVSRERLISLYAAAGESNEKIIIYSILQQIDASAASENVLRLAKSPSPPISEKKAAFRDAVLAIMNDLETDEGFRDLAHSLGFLQYKASAIISMEDTSACVKKHLALDSQGCTPKQPREELCLRPDWDPVGFIVSQAKEYEMSVRELPELGNTLTLTGSPILCYANTCRDYAQKNWPRVANTVISLLESALVEVFNLKKTPTKFICRSHSLAPRRGEESESKVLGKVVLSRSHIKLQLEGTLEDMIQLTQLMTWMTSALRLLPEQLSASVRQCSIHIAERASGLFLRPIFYDTDATSGSGLCWVSLLSRPVMATGFPILDRGTEVGLEIPLHIASSLIGSSHAAEYRGGVVVKGFSSMIVPERKTGNRIQWHLVSSKDEDTPLSYGEGVDRCPGRMKTPQADMGSLLAGRTFIGWHRNVASCMGSHPSSFDYSSIRESHARSPNSRVVVEGLKVGFHNIATAQINLKLAVPQSPTFFRTQRRRYAGIVRLADHTRVLLYDTAERRAWLVPASEVILHMIQYRLAQDPAIINGKPVRLNLTGDAGQDLISNAGVTIEEGYTFQNMVQSTWDMLEFLHSDLQTKKIPRPFSLLSPSLLGYEFRQCAEEASSFNLRQTSLTSGADGWVSLVKDSDNLVLFGRGFGDLMVPLVDEESIICPLWKTMPHGEDLMATSVKVLEQLYDQIPAQGSRRYLSQSKLEWHQGDSQLFEPCSIPQSACCCQRVQKITTSRYLGCKAPGVLSPSGGVIFGDCSKLKRRRTKTQEFGTSSPQRLHEKSEIGHTWSPESSPQIHGATGLGDRIPELVLGG